MADTDADASQPWYRSLNATQWKTLFASNLGWMFDGYETFALILTVGVALRSLLDPSLYPQIPAYAGTVIAITLLGWGVGGLIGGILADYIGRRRMMIYAILAYSLMTGLSALAWDWMSFAALRFLVGVAIGSEWSTGASMTAEVWPNHARGKGAGCMAHHVPARHPAGIRCAVDPRRGPGIGDVGSDGSETPCRARPPEERRG